MGLGTLGLFDGDHTFLVNLAHRLGDQLTDVVIVVGRNGGYLFDLANVAAHFLALLAQVLDYRSDGFVDTAFQVHRIGTCGNVFHTHAYNGLSQYSSGRRTVAGIVSSLGSDLFDHLCTHVGNRVFEFDLFGYGHAVLGHLRSAEFLIDYNVTSFRAERYLHSVCQRVDAFLELFARFGIVFNLFCHNLDCLNWVYTELND